MRQLRTYGKHLAAAFTLSCAATAVLAIASASANPNPREVSEYREDFGLSAKQAEEHLQVQGKAADADLAGGLEEELGDSYAGMWFDNEAGEYVVPVAAGTSGRSVASARADRELDRASVAGDSRIKDVRYSWEELQAAQAQIEVELTDLAREGKIRTSLDASTNAVVITAIAGLSGKERAEIAQATKGRDSLLEVRETRAPSLLIETDACRGLERNCDPPLRGGVGIGTVGQGYTSCTAAFPAQGDTNNRRYVLTAGHCAGNWQEYHVHWAAVNFDFDFKYIGEAKGVSFPPPGATGQGDWAAIDATGSKEWDTLPWPRQVAYWGEGYWNSEVIKEDYPIDGETASVEGSPVCHSGISSGTSCGYIAETGVTAHYGSGEKVENLVVVKGDHCNISGDSGGPWFAQNKAMGINSGSQEVSESEEKNCENTVSVYSEVPDATDALGLTIRADVQAAPSATTNSASNVQPYQAKLNGEVTPNGAQTDYHFDWGTTSGYGHRTSDQSAGSGTGPVGVDATITGLDPVTTYHFRVGAENSIGTDHGSDRTFTTPAAPPKVTTEGTANVRAEDETGKATLKGKVNPGGAQTDYRFEWGAQASGSFPNSAPVPDGDAGDGIAFKSVQAGIEGLKGSTKYHYRLRAENSKGTDVGSVKTFTTPDWRPTAETWHQSGSMRGGRAWLPGVVNPNGFATTYHFELGTTAEHEAGEYNNAGPELEAGSGESNVNVGQTLEGLKGETKYHFRLVAENANGIRYGEVKSFTTPSWKPRLKAGPRTIDVGREEATLTVAIDTMGFATDYRFEWGETSGYGNSAPVPDAELEAGEEYVDVYEPLEGLDSNQTYHFRVVAENTEGTKASGDKTFTTNTAGFVADEYPVDYQGSVEVQPGQFELLLGSSYYDCAYTNFGHGGGTEPIEELTSEGWGAGAYACQIGEEERTLEPNGCELTFDPGAGSEGQFGGEMAIGPPGCGPMTVEGAVNCTFSIPAQSGLEATFANVSAEAGSEVLIDVDSNYLRYTADKATCASAGTHRDGAIQASWELWGSDEAEVVDLRVSGAFEVAPAVATEQPTGLGEEQATLHGMVNPNLLGTSYQFQYTERADFEANGWENASVIPETPQSVGAGAEEVAVQQGLGGLDSGTRYIYRVIASNAEGESQSSPRGFTTAGLQLPRFEAEAYTATISGQQDPEGPLDLSVGGENGYLLSCDTGSFDSELPEASPGLSVAAEYGSCHETEGEEAEVSLAMNSCELELAVAPASLPHTGSAAIACAQEGDAIEIQTPECLIEIPAQSLPGAVSYENRGEGSERSVGVSIDAKEVHYVYAEGLCTFLGENHYGTLGNAFELEGSSEEEAAGLYVAGELMGLYAAGEESEDEAAQPRLEAEEYVAIVYGQQDAEGPLDLSVGGENGYLLSCDTGSFDSELPEASPALSVAAEYGECHETEGEEAEASLAMNSCELDLDLTNSGPPYTGSAAIACAQEGDAIEIQTPECLIEIPAQSLPGAVSYGSQGEGSERSVTVSIDAGEVHYVYAEGLCTFLGKNQYGTLSNAFELKGLG